MKISYAITVCSEFVEIQRLIPFLLENKRHEDEVVVLYDSKNGDNSVEEFLRAKSINGEFSWHKSKFNNHFADWKNKLTEKCNGDWIFQIDADEIPHIDLITYLPEIILSNPQNEVIKVPRVNTVYGLTEEYEKKWGWRVNAMGWVNWPDFQYRIWKNHPKIKWINKVHEVLDGYSTYADLNQEERFSLYHPKDIEKQIKQNNYYENI